MKLYASTTSPYARKVRIALIELGLGQEVELILTAPTEDPSLRRINPLGKIPVLQLDDGRVLYDSLVIIEYLDDLAGGSRLLPQLAEPRIAELRRHALAHGIIDAAFNATMELRRPQEQQSDFWLGRWKDAIEAGAAALAVEIPQDFSLSAVTAAVAFDYVRFRLGHLALDLDALGDWRRLHEKRPSLLATRPQIELA